MLVRDVGYPNRPEDLELVTGVAEAVQFLNDAGFLTVIVTNQAGVARGYFSEAQMHAFNALVVQRLAEKGAAISAVYSCPFRADAVDEAYRHPNHPDRNPNPGMLLHATADPDIDLGRSFMVGDQQTDIQAAAVAGIPGLFVRRGRLAPPRYELSFAGLIGSVFGKLSAAFIE